MRLLIVALVLLGGGALLFADWGMNTTAGKRAFDEMAGMIPMLVGLVGVVMLGMAAILAWYRRAD